MLNPLNLLIRFASLTRIELFAMNLLMLCLQERLTSKDQKISENFYVRGDGTVRALLNLYIMHSLRTINPFFF